MCGKFGHESPRNSAESKPSNSTEWVWGEFCWQGWVGFSLLPEVGGLLGVPLEPCRGILAVSHQRRFLRPSSSSSSLSLSSPKLSDTQVYAP